MFVGNQLRPMGPSDVVEVMRFCATKPAECTFIAGWVDDGGLSSGRGTLLAETDARGMTRGLFYMSSSGIAVPVLEDEPSFDAAVNIATRIPGMLRVIVGERSRVARLWGRLERLGLKAKASRRQRGYMVDRSTFDAEAPALELKVATPKELDWVVGASAAMSREEAKDDPQARNPTLFRARLAERLALGRDFISSARGQLVFKCNVSALSQAGGQVEGVYTPPAFRGRGIGRRGTAAVTRWVLDRSTRACLLVNEDNATAIRIYEALGYQRAFDSLTMVLT